jgi:signal transduction histidine kinase
MSRLPIRARLTLIFALVMAGVLVIIGSFLYYRTKHNLDDSIAQSLRARQGAARAYAQSAAGPGSSAIPPGERFAQVLTASGRVIASRPAGARAVLSPRQAEIAARGLRVFEQHERNRYLAGPAQIRGRRVIVVAGASLADHEKALEGLGGALLIGGPLALLLAAAIGYATAAGALRPVEEMRRRAATIGRADPSSLLPVPDVDDELKRLSLTLNEMLARIGQAAEHERRFIANASHELRTPLAALQAELEIAERHPSSADHLRAAIALARQDVARLIALSNGLLDLAAADEDLPAFERVDVDDLLQAIAGDLRHRMSGGQRAMVARPSGLTVTADESALRRAVSNLAENAVVHGAGDITLGADLIADRDCVELWVHDHGSLSPSLGEDEAFERFARGREATGRPGAGLGLALVRTVAEAHGGTAQLASGPAGGVRAILRLPAQGRLGSV